MAKKIVSSNFKTNLIEQFIESVDEAANTTYYSFIGNHIQSGDTDGDILQPEDSVRELRIDAYRDMILGKKLNTDDFKVLCDRNDWVEGSVYAMYDDLDANLLSKNFIVAVDETAYVHVYKCLYNANGAPSTTKPTFADVRYDADLFQVGDNYYETDDGYQWKYMYTIDSKTFRKFSTQKYIPITANTVSEQNAQNGSIDVIKVDLHGKGYTNHISGQFTAGDIRVEGSATQFGLPQGASTELNFYKNTILSLTSGAGAGQYKKVIGSRLIVALDLVIVELEDSFDDIPDTSTRFEISPEVKIISDGSQSVNAVARAIINANASDSVHKVEMLNTGRDYSYATAEVLVGESPISGVFDNIIPAEVRPINPPAGGHGANTNVEVNGTHIAIYADFIRDENGTALAENTFSQFGIIRDPLFANVEIETLTLSDGSSGSDGLFLQDEEFFQLENLRLYSGVTTVANSVTVEFNETDTDITTYLAPGDYLYIEDAVTTATKHHISKILSITDENTLVLEDAVSWSSNIAKIYLARVRSRGKIKNVSSNSKFFGKDVDDNLQLGKMIIGLDSKAVANVNTINTQNRFNTGVGENFQFTTFNQMTKIKGTISSGTFAADELVFQGLSLSDATSTAYVHSTNGTDEIFLTRVTGTIDTSQTINGSENGAQIAGGTFDKYEGDLDPTTGTIIFLQNDIPVEREGNQSEEIRIILEF